MQRGTHGLQDRLKNPHSTHRYEVLHPEAMEAYTTPLLEHTCALQGSTHARLMALPPIQTTYHHHTPSHQYAQRVPINPTLARYEIV